MIILSNANNALDTFSSPHGFSVLDGVTERDVVTRLLEQVPVPR